MEKLVTVQVVADYLKMSPQTIYRFAQQGRIPALKVGNRWRFRLADIEAWLQQQEDRLAPNPDYREYEGPRIGRDWRGGDEGGPDIVY